MNQALPINLPLTNLPESLPLTSLPVPLDVVLAPKKIAVAPPVSRAWTEDRVTLLRKLWADGLSASQIAAEIGGRLTIGGCLTRNAVIGKLHRLGLTSSDCKRTNRSHTQVRRRPQTVRVKQADGSVVEQKESEIPELLDNAIPVGQRRTFLELTADTCHWPVGHPGCADFFFCGGPVVEGRQYCPYHARVAYQPGSAFQGGRVRMPLTSSGQVERTKAPVLEYDSMPHYFPPAVPA